MATVNRFTFLAIAMVFHLVYIYSIFDVYFVSPIVSGMQLISVERPAGVKAPADRLVLFVGDGLRADKSFQSFPNPSPQADDDDLTPRPLAPFLRSRVLEHGTFGVSHTRVPTESRPGHVALIAGLYEDVSAVATGWKLNPVNFDSVFNRSRHTWSWGSPDILPMFEKGATPGRIDAYCYDAEFEDFSQEAIHLDYWVFDHVKELFAEAEKNKTLNAALREEKVAFFLHLLGLDTSGHTFRPWSKEYLHNIQVVDQGVKEISELINKFYGDDRTAFVFTADHGMSDWGSHGDGHPDNTRTPLITWGSGIAKPVVHADSVAPGHDEYSADWNLDHIKRHDVSQADVAALMAHLLGVEFPANSVGELPLSYLSGTLQEKAEASLLNAREILEMYRVKEVHKKDTQLRYKPYKPLSADVQTAEDRLQAIRQLIDAGSYEEAIEETAALIKLGLDGLRYLQTYDWLFLRALITIGYLGWISFALTTVLDLHVLQGSTKPKRSLGGALFFSSALAMLYASFIASHSPATYYAYALFPVLFWEEVYARRESIVKGRQALFGHVQSGSKALSLLFSTVSYLGIVESLALAYIHRQLLTVLFYIGALYPVALGISFLQQHAFLSATWFVSCVVMGTFTLLPAAMDSENIPLITLGGVLMVIVGVVYLLFEDSILADFSSRSTRPPAKKGNTISKTLVGIQTGLIILAIFVTRSSALSIQSKAGLPRGNQVVGWLTLVTSLLMPFAHRLQPNNHYLHRLLVIFLTFAPTFVILCISYEGLFYFAYCITLLTWVRLEHHGQIFKNSLTPTASTKEVVNGSAQSTVSAISSKFRPLALSDARVALFFFVLLQSAFFSTGNVASVSSFSMESVARLIPIFDPFSQGALLTVKLMIPFALISANLGILNIRLGVAPSALFMVAMALSDVLTLYFFWVVKDEGSWLEIGSTISHFVIASLLCIFVAALEGVSAFFIAGVEVASDHNKSQKGSETPAAAMDVAADIIISEAVETMTGVNNDQNGQTAGKNLGDLKTD
ncbi:GPI ethanolamine phosphate transferase-like protein [Xylariales sp. PMI_506]|nr:GPI ethanolamine phosphate transferase-like protein [Xylariales sp. PMI_506]